MSLVQIELPNKSIVKPKSFYIGSTPDPVRRLKQHNGELKAGGAFRTKRSGFRPWRMLLIVYGLPSKIAALQLEHAFQHPHTTRHISNQSRLSKSRGSGQNSLHLKLANLRLLLASTYFSSFNLKLIIFSQETWKSWSDNKHNIDISYHVDAQHSNYNTFFKLDRLIEPDGGSVAFDDVNHHQTSLFETAKEVMVNTINKCLVCHKTMDLLPDEPNLDLLVTCCANCCATFHLDCLAKEILSEDEILPTKGPCPNCTTMIIWNDMAWLATHLRKYCLSV